MDEVKRIDNQILIRKAMIDAIGNGHTIGEIRSIAEKMNVSMWQIFSACVEGHVPMYTRKDGVILTDVTALIAALKDRCKDAENKSVSVTNVEYRG